MTALTNLVELLDAAIRFGYPLKSNDAYQALRTELREWPDKLIRQPPYLIQFDDADRRPEVWTDRAAAHHRYREISVSWNAHLFVKIDSNSRDALKNSPNHPSGRDSEAGKAAIEFALAFFDKERADQSKDAGRQLAAKKRLFIARTIVRDYLNEGSKTT